MSSIHPRGRSHSRDGHSRTDNSEKNDRRSHRHAQSGRVELDDGDQSKRPQRHRSHSRTPPPRGRLRSRSTSRGPVSARPRSYSRSHSRESGRHSRPGGEKRNHRSKKSERRKRSRSPATSSSDTDSGSDRKRHKKKKRRSREEKERRRKEKKEKKRKHGIGSSSAHWGKYGIISDSDFYNKTQEFRIWLLEERKINPEGLSKDQERKEFAVFVEDYNTATLPHEKYYHMEAYERRMTSLRSGEFIPPSQDTYDPVADMKAHATRHKKAAADQDSYMSREQLMELRKVQNERVEIGRMKRLGMEVKQNMGVRMDGSMFDG